MSDDLVKLWVYLAADPLLWLTLTLVAYQGGLWLHRRHGGNPLLNPVLIAVLLLVGVVLMFVWYLFPRSKPFFSGRSLNRSTPVMVPDEPGDFVRSIDGGI